jgi:hypothetical protein
VNSLGAKLRGSDLALAQITARWPNSLKLMEEFQEECEESWFTFDLGLLVRTNGGVCDRSIEIPIRVGGSHRSLQRGLGKCEGGLEVRDNFLQTNAHIEDESLLSSPYFFITLAYLSQKRGERLTKQEERDLLYWVLAGGLFEHEEVLAFEASPGAGLANGRVKPVLLATRKLEFGEHRQQPAKLQLDDS